MRKRNGVILTVIGIVFFGFIFYFLPFANAEVPVSQYDELKNTKDFKLYIKGVGTGFSWANVVLEGRGQQPLYCPPSKLEVTAENYLDILRLYIEKKRSRLEKVPNAVIEPLLLYGLIETFSCEK